MTSKVRAYVRDVGKVAHALITAWKGMPAAWSELKRVLVDARYSGTTVLIIAAAPLIFWLAPLLDYLFKRDDARVEAARKKVQEDYLKDAMKLTQTQQEKAQ